MNKLRLTILLLFGCMSLMAQNVEVDKKLIKQIMLQQESSWNEGDIEAYMQGYWNSDSLLFIGSKGPTYGWQKTMDNYLKSYPDKKAMGKLSFEFIQIEILNNNWAHVIGSWRLDRERDVLKGYYSLLWKKIDGVWKIIADHSS